MSSRLSRQMVEALALHIDGPADVKPDMTVRTLLDRGLIEPDQEKTRITEAGRHALAKGLSDMCDALIATENNRPVKPLELTELQRHRPTVSMPDQTTSATKKKHATTMITARTTSFCLIGGIAL